MVGVSDRTRAESGDLAVFEGVPAAVAVLGESGTVERATSAFVERFEVRDGSLTGCPDEVGLIAAGESDHASVVLDGVEGDVVAVVDVHGRRTAVLTIPIAREVEDLEPTGQMLEEPVDESPAIVWLKDLDGRYLHVNSRYIEQLGTETELVYGHTDAELTASASIEGLRLEEKDTAGQEPLELEYMIGAFEERPAFAALRFALRDGDGQPTAICGVAAPLSEASLARSECERLMRIDRWRRLDAMAIRQELLDDWGLTLADGSSGPPLDRDDRVAAVLAERDEALASAARLERELATEREKLDGLRAESELAAQRAEELDGTVAAEQARASELEQSLTRAEDRVGELEDELAAARTALEERVRASAGASGPRVGAGQRGRPLEHRLPTRLLGRARWPDGVALGARARGRDARRRGRMGRHRRLVQGRTAVVDALRGDLDARAGGPGGVPEPHLAPPQGRLDRRVRSRPQPHGDGLRARVALGGGPAAEGRGGGRHGLGAAGADQRRRRHDRDARAAVTEHHRAQRGADGLP